MSSSDKDNPIFSFLSSTLENEPAPLDVVKDMDWKKLMAFASKQAIVGVAFKGVKLCRLQYPEYVTKQDLMRGLVATEKIKERNHLLNQKCVELQNKLSDAGFRSTILKGQGLAKYYNEELRLLRNPGDIDVYVDCTKDEAISYAKSLGQKDIHWDYKHLHLHIWERTSIELHYRVEIVHNPFKNARLQRWFDKNKELLFCDDGIMVTPSLSMNLFFILVHIYSHFFGSGIGLKQLIDYYYVVRSANGHFDTFSDGETLNDVLNHFGMTRFAGGVMWLLHEVTGLDPKYMYCLPLEKEGRCILNEMLTSGNLGLYDERVRNSRMGKVGEMLNICKHNVYLLKMFPQDALMSPLWYLWHKVWMVRHL
jgi:hypothetical protein